MADENGSAGAAGAPSATVEAAAAAPPAGLGAPNGATDSPSQPDIWEQVSGLDPDELVKRHPRLAGRLGTMSQKQAQTLAAQQVAEYRQQEAQRIAAEMFQREQAERIRLAREDPDRLAQQVLAEAAQSSQANERAQQWQEYVQATQARLQEQIDAIYQEPEVKELWESGDDAMRRRLDYRSYPDFTKFSLGIAKALVDSASGKRAEELAKARLEALQADSKTQQFRRDGAAGADLGLGGGPPAGHVFTREEITRMDTATYRKYKAAISEQEAAGLI